MDEEKKFDETNMDGEVGGMGYGSDEDKPVNEEQIDAVLKERA